MGVIFIAGCYGVGKSTIIEKLSDLTNIPNFSAGKLISEANKENYGRNKFVENKNNNQRILVQKIEEKLSVHSRIFLDGHFCIFKQNNVPDPLPFESLEQMHFEQIILLEADSAVILQNLKGRDQKQYNETNIKSLMEMERSQAQLFSEKNKIPLSIYHMTFSDKDINNIMFVL
jgi:adenylate kinase